MNQNGGIHKGGFAVLCHRNGGSESPGILNRSYLVNSQAIEKLRFNRVYLWNHEELPVSKKRYQEIKKVFKPSPPPESLTPPILF